MSIIYKVFATFLLLSIFTSCSMFQSKQKRDIASDPCANQYEYDENKKSPDQNYNRCHGL